jgi:hypothetical protein
LQQHVACAGMTRKEMKIKGLFVLFFVLALSAPAHAFPAKDLEAYCQDGNHNYKVTPGMQLNHLPALRPVLDLAPGIYKMPDGSRLQVNGIFEAQVTDNNLKAKPVYTTQKANSYTLWIQPQKNPIFGTNGADKIAGHEIGGCSLEQLSELLQRNSLPVQFEEDKEAEEKEGQK